jgi:6-phosphofructokinase 1
VNRRIGILTSGGDAPGMNAAIRTAVRAALHFNLEPWGIFRGYHGLINGELQPMTSRDVSGIIQRGGTILKSARSDLFKTPEGRDRAVDMLRKHNIESLIVIGGDGSFRGALSLQEKGINVLGIPGTIDNDIPCTDFSIGFDTAVNTVMDAVNKIRDTASSHDRAYLVEVMGRHSGYIALYSGLACGADVILIPEVPLDLDEVCSKLATAVDEGKTFNIIVVAEGVRPAQADGQRKSGDADRPLHRVKDEPGDPHHDLGPYPEGWSSHSAGSGSCQSAGLLRRRAGGAGCGRQNGGRGRPESCGL